jgi:hypothetical protein
MTELFHFSDFIYCACIENMKINKPLQSFKGLSSVQFSTENAEPEISSNQYQNCSKKVLRKED